MDAKRFLVVFAAAVAGAVVIPLDRPGVGWAIAGVVSLALLRNWFGLIAAALLGMGAIRSAGWVFALCAVAAMVLLAATVVNGRTWRELGFALPRWAWGGWQGMRSGAATTDRHGAVRLARAIGIGIVLVIVFGLLLGSAEQRFAEVLRPLLSWPRLVTFATVALLCFGAQHLRGMRPGAQAAPGPAAELAEARVAVVGSEPAVVGSGRGGAGEVPGGATGSREAAGGAAAGGPAGVGVAGGPAGGGVAGGPAGGVAVPGVAVPGVAVPGIAVPRSAVPGVALAEPRRLAAPDESAGSSTPARPWSPVMPTAPRDLVARREVSRREWGRYEWVIPVALLDLLFVTFAIVQFTVLFGGHEHVLDPNGPTYAQYARGGFLELATVTVLTLAVVAVVLSRIAPADGPPARLLIGLLCGLTLVIVGSALWRMRLYVEAFGFTRSRLLATAFIIWLGLILLLLIAVWRRAILPRLTLAAGALVLLSLAVLNPDRVVAQTVIGRWEKDGHLDAPYLASLSPDALPALETLPEPKRSCIAAVIVRRQPHRGDAWNEWNASRAAASRVRLREDNCYYYLTRGYRMEGNWTDPSQLRQGGVTTR